MISMHWETPIRAPPRLLEVSTICCLSDSFNVSLTDDVSLSSFQGISSSASSFHPSQVIDGVMSLALCPQLVAEAPQHVGSSETQSICDGCFACQPICLVISIHSSMFRSVHPHKFPNVDVEH